MLIQAKLSIPEMPSHLLLRSQLLEQLTEPMTQRRIVISAPAGYGKSTLAALWLRHIAPKQAVDNQPQPHLGWVALDEEDNDPATLMRYIVAAVAPAVPQAAADANACLEQTTPSPRKALTTVLAALEACATPVYLVLDDLHRVTSEEALALVHLLLERCPPKMHLLLLTRQRAAVRLGRQRLQNTVLEIDREELCLSRAEVAEYVANHRMSGLDETVVDLMAARTEGWIAGLHLLLLSIRSSASNATIDDLAATIRSSNHMLTEYLTEEVVSRQSGEMRRFLLETSILDRLSAPLCEAVTGLAHSGRLLESIAEADLFLRPLDKGRIWYQLHELFRDMLHNQLIRKYSTDAVQQFHRRAANWYASQEHIDPALHHYLAAGAFTTAVDLIEHNARHALHVQEYAALRRRVALLPSEILDRRPQLLLDIAWLGLHTEDGNPIAALTRAERAAMSFPGGPIPQRWRDELVALRMMSDVGSRTFENKYASNRAALAAMAPESHLARGWAAMALAAEAMATQTIGDEIVLLKIADSAFAALDDVGGVAGVLILRAGNEVELGRAAEALTGFGQAIDLILSAGNRSLLVAVIAAQQLGRVCYLLNRLDDASAHFHKALEMLRRVESPLMTLWVHRSLQCCDLARRQPSSSLSDKQEQALWRQVAATQPVTTVANLFLLKVQQAIMKNEPLHLSEATRLFGLTLSGLDDSAHLLVWESLLTVAVLSDSVTRAEWATIDALLPRFIAMANRRGSFLRMLHGELLSAAWLNRRGDVGAAKASVGRALTIAESTGYVRPLLDLPAVYELTLQSRSLAPRLLALLNDSAPPTLSLSTQEKRLLELLALGHSNQEIAAALCLAPNTVKRYLSNLYAKIGVNTRLQAVARAREMGLVN